MHWWGTLQITLFPVLLMENVIWIASITIQFIFYDPSQMKMQINFSHQCLVTSQLSYHTWMRMNGQIRPYSTRSFELSNENKSRLGFYDYIFVFVYVKVIYIKPLVLSLPAFFKIFLQRRKCLLWLPGPTYTSTHVTPCHSLAPTQYVALWQKQKQNRSTLPCFQRNICRRKGHLKRGHF